MNNKIHFGHLENCGDFERPEYHIEKTICGVDSERVVESLTFSDWSLVTCKNCLAVKYKMERENLTEFENKLLQLLYPIKEETWFKNFISDFRRIMPPTCGEEQRKFLDELAIKYELKTEIVDNTSFVYLANAPSIIYQYDFKADLQKVMTGE